MSSGVEQINTKLEFGMHKTAVPFQPGLPLIRPSHLPSEWMLRNSAQLGFGLQQFNSLGWLSTVVSMLCCRHFQAAGAQALRRFVLIKSQIGFQGSRVCPPLRVGGSLFLAPAFNGPSVAVAATVLSAHHRNHFSSSCGSSFERLSRRRFSTNTPTPMSADHHNHQEEAKADGVQVPSCFGVSGLEPPRPHREPKVICVVLALTSSIRVIFGHIRSTVLASEGDCFNLCLCSLGTEIRAADQHTHTRCLVCLKKKKGPINGISTIEELQPLVFEAVYMHFYLDCC